jgi:hypothetical protein
MSKQGVETMKKSILIIVMIFCGVLPAAAEETIDYALTATVLPPRFPSPLDGLDLIPTAVSKTALSTPNLNPNQVSINPGHRYLIQGLRTSDIGDTAFDASLVVMVALNVADYFSTKEALKYPGLSEGNPLMKPFVKDPLVFAAAKAGFTLFSYWNLKSVYKKSKALGWVLSVAGNFAMSYIVSNNYRLISQAQGR